MLVACLLVAGRSPRSIIHAKIAGNEGLCLGQDYLVFGRPRTLFFMTACRKGRPGKDRHRCFHLGPDWRSPGRQAAATRREGVVM